MNYLEHFDYSNFARFHNEIESNPDIVKPRDYYGERVLDFFGLTEDEVQIIDKIEILKDLYKFISLTFYLTFKNNSEEEKVDPEFLKSVEREFPEDTGMLRRNFENWQYYSTYYSGVIDALSKVAKIRNTRKFKEIFGNNDGEETSEGGGED